MVYHRRCDLFHTSSFEKSKPSKNENEVETRKGGKKENPGNNSTKMFRLQYVDIHWLCTDILYRQTHWILFHCVQLKLLLSIGVVCILRSNFALFCSRFSSLPVAIWTWLTVFCFFLLPLLFSEFDNKLEKVQRAELFHFSLNSLCSGLVKGRRREHNNGNIDAETAMKPLRSKVAQ